MAIWTFDGIKTETRTSTKYWWQQGYRLTVLIHERRKKSSYILTDGHINERKCDLYLNQQKVLTHRTYGNGGAVIAWCLNLR